MAEALGFCVFETAIGPCGIAWSESLIVGAQLPEASRDATRARMRARFPECEESPPPPWIRAATQRLRAHLRGARDDLCDLPLDLERVPDFHRRVYELTRAIPPGQTLSYGEVAQRLEAPGASRAVGQALGHNPFAPIVPCHRVLATQGRSGGFSATGGARTKLRLLQAERAAFGGQPGLFD